MRLKFVSGTVFLAALAAVLLLPGSALPVAEIQEDQGLAAEFQAFSRSPEIDD
jgi:hypothetical protein